KWSLLEGDICTHEAGHIVAARCMGMPVYDARVSPDRAAGVAGVLAPSRPDQIGVAACTPDQTSAILLQAAGLIWRGLDASEAALRFAVMLVAGRQAEMIGAGQPLTGELRMHDPDHLQARAILQATNQRLSMTWAQRQARHLLTTAWPDVEAIAGALRRDGYWAAGRVEGRGAPIRTTG
ncbi:MAG: hypothetical protein ACYCWC_15385, partial [Rhodocyclaceae bacterium]